MGETAIFFPRSLARGIKSITGPFRIGDNTVRPDLRVETVNRAEWSS